MHKPLFHKWVPALLVYIISATTAIRPIQFQSSIKARSTSFKVCPGNRNLDAWFRNPTACKILLGAAETVTETGVDRFRITTAGPAFPGLSVRSENDVRIERAAGPSISLILEDTKLMANGPPFLKRIFTASLPELTLYSVNRYVCSNKPVKQ